LDKIEISSKHIAQNILLRVKVFDHESVKKAIDSITSHAGHDVFFAGPDVSTELHQSNIVRQSTQFYLYYPLILFINFFVVFTQDVCAITEQCVKNT
jgi:hypothetical protein